MVSTFCATSPGYFGADALLKSSGHADQTFGFVGFPSPTISLYQLGFTGKYDLDIWGKKRRASEAAAARAEADQRR